MAITKSNMLKFTGNNNDAGIASIVYFGEADKVRHWPQYGEEAGFESLGQVEGDLLFAIGERLYEAYVTPETGKLLTKGAGDRDGMSSDTVATIFIPGITPKNLGFFEYFKNRNIVMVVPDLDGQMRLVGSKLLPCNIVAFEADTTDVITGRKGCKFDIKVIGRTAPFYSGYVQLKPTVATITRSIVFKEDGVVAATSVVDQVISVEFLATITDALFDLPTFKFINSIPAMSEEEAWFRVDKDGVEIAIAKPTVNTAIPFVPGDLGLRVKGAFASAGTYGYTIEYNAKNLVEPVRSTGSIEIA